MFFFCPARALDCCRLKKNLFKNIFNKQLKKIQNSNTSSLSGDMMTGFVLAAVVGAGVKRAQRSVV